MTDEPGFRRETRSTIGAEEMVVYLKAKLSEAEARLAAAELPRDERLAATARALTRRTAERDRYKADAERWHQLVIAFRREFLMSAVEHEGMSHAEAVTKLADFEGEALANLDREMER